MISFKINSVDLNAVCCVRIGSRRQWTSVSYGTLSAEFEQTFTFAPEAYCYSISIYHNKELSESFIVDQTSEQDANEGLVLLGRIVDEPFPAKLRQFKRAVYATGNSAYCKAPLVEYEVTLSVPAVKQIKRLLLQHEVKKESGSKDRSTQYGDSEVQPREQQPSKHVSEFEKSTVFQALQQDEQKIIFKSEIHPRKASQQESYSSEIIKLHKVKLVADEDKRIAVSRPNNSEEKSKANPVQQNTQQETQDQQISQQCIECLPANDNQQSLIEKEQLNIIKGLICSRQQKNQVSPKRRRQKHPQEDGHFSPTSKSGSQSDQWPQATIRNTASEFVKASQSRLSSPNRAGSITLEKEERQANLISSPRKERKRTFQMLQTIEPVEEEDDDTTDKLHRRKTETDIIILPNSPSKFHLRYNSRMLPPVLPSHAPLLSQRRPSHSRNSRQSKQASSEKMQHYLESSQQPLAAGRHQIHEYLVLNTIIFQNLDRQSHPKPTCLMLQHSEAVVYTESISEKSILFTRQILPLSKQDNQLTISVYEEFEGRKILFGKAQTTIAALRKTQQSRTLKLQVEICNFKVGELLINHEISPVHPNNKETVRARQSSLRQQTISRYSSGSNRKYSILPLTKSENRAVRASSLLPPLTHS